MNMSFSYTGLPSASIFYQLFQYLNPDGKRSNVVYRATDQKWAERQNVDLGNASWRGQCGSRTST